MFPTDVSRESLSHLFTVTFLEPSSYVWLYSNSESSRFKNVTYKFVGNVKFQYKNV